jgi:hypothetical protein
MVNKLDLIKILIGLKLNQDHLTCRVPGWLKEAKNMDHSATRYLDHGLQTSVNPDICTYFDIIQDLFPFPYGYFQHSLKNLSILGMGIRDLRLRMSGRGGQTRAMFP